MKLNGRQVAGAAFAVDNLHLLKSGMMKLSPEELTLVIFARKGVSKGLA